MQINIKERVDVNQDGPSLIIEASPPPPGPQIAKDVFHIWKTYYLLFSLLYLCLQCDEVFMTFYYLWIQHTVPQKEVNNKFSSDYFHILHVVGG